jgi:hypothetical protein
MGLCNKCREILPPSVMFVTEKGEQVCAYCKTGKNVITLDFDDGTSKTLSKQEAIGKYREFTENVLNKPGVKNLLVKDDKKKLIT